MSLRVLVVDDEPLACERLRALLEELPGVSVAGSAHDGPRALELAAELKPDLLLLDVRMPGMDGLEVVRHLSLLDDPPAVVFATAHDEYAMEAFEAQAIGYLLKPVRKERLAVAIERARRLTRRQIEGMQAVAASTGRAAASRSQIAIRLRDRLKLVRVQEILYFAADRKYTTVCHTQGKDLIEDSLRSLEEEFAPNFVRIHRNTVVNGAMITAIEKTAEGQYCVLLRGLAEQLPVSRRLMGELKLRFDL